MQTPLRCALFHVVVRCFARDDDVVNVRLAEPCAADAHETRVLLQLGDGLAAKVAHAAAQAADQLVDHVAQRSAIGHAALDTLGYELGEPVVDGRLR